MNNENNVSRDATILSISKVLNMALVMVSAMLLARFRTLEEYGTYSQILTVVNLATAIFMLGLPNSMNYFVARAKNEEDRSKFLTLYYNIVTIMSILVGVFLFLVLPLIIRYYDNQCIERFGYVLFILPWTQILIGGISNMLIASGNTFKVLVYNLSRGIALLAIILLVQILNESFMTYMAYYTIVESLFSIWVYIEAKRLVPKWRIRIDKKLLCEVFKFSIPMGIASAISTLSIQLDQLMVGKFFTTEELAVFSNAAKELPFTIIASAFTAVLVPKMARLFRDNRNEDAIEIWKKTVELNAIIIFFFAATCVVFAPQIMTILYSEKYIAGVSVFRVYGLVLLMRVTYFGMVLNSKGRTKLIMYSSIVSLILNFILNFILMSFFGMLGAALATLFSLGIIGFMQLLFSSKILNIGLMHIFPWKRLLHIVLVNTIWGLVAYYVLYVFSIGIVTMDIIKAICIGCVFAIIYTIVVGKRFMSLYKEIGKI